MQNASEARSARIAGKPSAKELTSTMIAASQPFEPARANYGYDAPGIMLGLLLGRLVTVGAGCLVATAFIGRRRYAGLVLAIGGVVPIFLGLLMLIYAFAGKARARDHILDLARLDGAESVLDVGTGAGLLLVGAATRLRAGRVVGVDLWAAKDLSNNAAAVTLRNADVEGVGDRITVLAGDARALDFPDASFDRVVSLLCLHNLAERADQSQACREIARVLKPGGRVVVGDYVPTHAYAHALAAAGLTVMQSRAASVVALSLMWVVLADKPADRSRR